MFSVKACYCMLFLSLLLWECFPFPVTTAKTSHSAFIARTTTRDRTCQREPNACLTGSVTDTDGDVYDGLGLLRGVDKEKDSYYSRCLEANSLDDLLKQSAWKAAEDEFGEPTYQKIKDYLDQVLKQMVLFRLSDIVYNHEQFSRFLHREIYIKRENFAWSWGAKVLANLWCWRTW